MSTGKSEAAAWSSQERVLLLDGVGLHGFSNWDAIATHVRTKTAEQCESFYLAEFLDRDAPAPPPSQGSVMPGHHNIMHAIRRRSSGGWPGNHTWRGVGWLPPAPR